MSLEKVNKVCIQVKELDMGTIDAAIDDATQQFTYAHPLKAKTAGKIQSAGQRNLEILRKLKELKNLIDG